MTEHLTMSMFATREDLNKAKIEKKIQADFEKWWETQPSSKPFSRAQDSFDGFKAAAVPLHKEIERLKIELALAGPTYSTRQLEERLAEAEKVIGFYANATNNPKKYMRQGYEVYNLKKAIFIDGGERAREYFAKWSKK